MNRNTDKYEELIKKFTEWANRRSDIKSAHVVGSQVRANRPADEWADLDITFLTTRPDYYFDHTDWIQNLGRAAVKFQGQNHTGEREWRVIFDNGTVLDLSIIKYPGSRLSLKIVVLFDRFPGLMGALFPGIQRQIEEARVADAEVLDRGYRVLFDKTGTVSWWIQMVGPPRKTLPSQHEYLAYHEELWFRFHHLASRIRRNEYFVASHTYSNILFLLGNLIKRHAQALNGQDYDTWHSGRFLEQWADKRVVEKLQGLSIRHNQPDLCRTLYHTIDIFRLMSKEVANRSGFPYPSELDEKMMCMVNGILPECV